MGKTIHETEHFFVVDVGNGNINVVPKVGSHAILIKWSPEGTYVTAPVKMEIVPFGQNPTILIPTVETD